MVIKHENDWHTITNYEEIKLIKEDISSNASWIYPQFCLPQVTDKHENQSLRMVCSFDNQENLGLLPQGVVGISVKLL